MKYINLTPHVVRLNDGREFPPSGVVARVAQTYGPWDELLIGHVQWGDIEGLPAVLEDDDDVLIVSAVVAQRARHRRVVAPATGHPACIRDAAGQVVSVPGFLCFLW